jgi:hypothetical protein
MSDYTEKARQIVDANAEGEHARYVLSYQGMIEAIALALEEAVKAEREAWESTDNRRKQTVPTHVYTPHAKYPWFCDRCGYPEHVTIHGVELAAAIRNLKDTSHG